MHLVELAVTFDTYLMTLLYFTLTTHTHTHSQAHTGHSNPNLKRSLQHISFLTLPHALLIPCITPHTSHSLHYPTHFTFLTLHHTHLIPCITPRIFHVTNRPTHLLIQTTECAPKPWESTSDSEAYVRTD